MPAAAAAETSTVEGWLPNPEVMVGWYETSVETRVGPQEWSLGLRQKVPFPTKLATKAELGGVEAKVARVVYERVVRDVLTDVVHASHELAYLEEAFSGLDSADVSLGMGHDGGYYLIGMKRVHPTLFQDIAWSTEQVIPQTLAGCERLGLTVHTLPEWYDVDVAADLDRLRYDLAQNPASAPRTHKFLQLLGEI